MPTDLAQSPKGDEDRTKVDPDPRPSGLNVVETAESEDGPVDRYLPSKWNWGPPRSSFDW
jgi:hypothetical protein